MNKSYFTSFFGMLILPMFFACSGNASTGYIPRPPKEIESCEWYLTINETHTKREIQRLAGDGVIQKLKAILKPGKYSIKHLFRAEHEEKQLAPQANAISFKFRKTWLLKDYLEIVWWSDESKLHTYAVHDFNARSGRSKTKMVIVTDESRKLIKLSYDPIADNLRAVRFNLFFASDRSGQPTGFSLEHTESLAPNVNLDLAWFSDLEILAKR